MSYIGRPLRGEPLPANLDFNRAALVLVTGTLPNTCGHVLLYVGGSMGHYFHFNGPSLFNYPRYMTESEYRAYLRTEGKTEVMRRRSEVPHPGKATAKLRELMDGKWLSFLVSHNCASFAGEVLQAGGNFYTIPDHCPAMDLASEAFWERIFGPIRRRLGTDGAYKADRVH